MLSTLWDATTSLLEQPTTGSQSPGFGSWTQVDANNGNMAVGRPRCFDVRADDHKCIIDVDESGDNGAADYTYHHQLTGLSGTDEQVTTIHVPAGGQYQIRDVASSGTNAIDTVRTITL